MADFSFNSSELNRVYHGGNACPFRRVVLSKMAKSEQIEIVIVGGSVTYGADLRDRLKLVTVSALFRVKSAIE